MLNPFRGVLQTIEADRVDAASLDGLQWGLYISDESSYSFLDMNSVAPFHSTDVKYGEWSERQGLLRSPSLPSMNHERIAALGETILAHVQAQSGNVPFPLQDHYERWLLDDAQGRPAVLLESSYDMDGVKYNSNTVWRVGQFAQREFASTCSVIGKLGESAAETLQTRLNQQCKQGKTIWVRREGNGEVLVLPRPSEDRTIGQGLSEDEFPRYGLRTDWPDDSLSCLCRAYLQWLSPWLLLMFPTEDGELEELLAQALQYPDRLYRVRRLLPAAMLARKDVKAALVQADLSRSG